jgi:hypothetical protein
MVKVISLVILACAMSATAQSFNDSEFPGTSGSAFIKMCSVVDQATKEMTHLDAMKLMTCVGYVAGAADGIQAEVGFLDLRGSKVLHLPFCLGDHVQRGDLVKIVLRYVKYHPETNHLPTAALALAAFREAFPCQQL